MARQTVPQRAGDSSLLSQLVEGSIVMLQSRASGKTLRSLHGTAEGNGGFGGHAQWKVHVRRPGVIALQNVHTSDNWLAIRNGKTIGNGRGGPFCEFIVLEVKGHVVLESVQYRGQHVGVRPNGAIREPGRTGTGQHAQFVLNVQKSIKFQFVDGSVVILESCASGKSLRSYHGTAEGIGGRGQHAQWRVHVRRPGVLALQNVHTSAHWLAIRDGKTIGNGGGGPYCDFTVEESNGNVVLESVQYRGQHVGVLPNGTIKEPGRTGTGHHAQFRLIQHSQPQEVVSGVSKQMAGLQLTSPLLSMFAHGCEVILVSKASGKTLRSYHGTAQGIGGHGTHAQWKVHVRRPGVIALQNVHTSDNWLAIRDGKTIGNGGGGAFCELVLQEVNDHIVLESAQHPRQHVGVLPDGSIKPPTQTGKGPHAQFKPILHKQAPQSSGGHCSVPAPARPPVCAAYPPPQNPAYPMGYQAPPPYGYPGYQAPLVPPAGYQQPPPVSGYPGYPSAPGYQAPPTSAYPRQSAPPGNYPGYP